MLLSFFFTSLIIKRSLFVCISKTSLTILLKVAFEKKFAIFNISIELSICELHAVISFLLKYDLIRSLKISALRQKSRVNDGEVSCLSLRRR